MATGIPLYRCNVLSSSLIISTAHGGGALVCSLEIGQRDWLGVRIGDMFSNELSVYNEENTSLVNGKRATGLAREHISVGYHLPLNGCQPCPVEWSKLNRDTRGQYQSTFRVKCFISIIRVVHALAQIQCKCPSDLPAHSSSAR